MSVILFDELNKTMTVFLFLSSSLFFTLLSCFTDGSQDGDQVTSSLVSLNLYKHDVLDSVVFSATIFLCMFLFLFFIHIFCMFLFHFLFGCVYIVICAFLKNAHLILKIPHFNSKLMK